MKQYTMMVNAMSLLLFSVACSDERVTPVGCLRISADTHLTVESIAAHLDEKRPDFSLESYEGQFTGRQESAGAQWIVMRDTSLEVSLRSHPEGFSDVCVYDHSNDNGKVDAGAQEVLGYVASYLEDNGAEYTEID